MSFIKIFNSRGPKTDPCRTLTLTGKTSDFIFVTYDILILYWFFNFSTRIISTFTVSNALRISGNKHMQ